MRTVVVENVSELESLVSSRLGKPCRLVRLSVKCTYPVFRAEAEGCPPVFVKVGLREEWERMDRVLRALGETGLVARMLTDEPVAYRDQVVFVMSWADGMTVFPEYMTDRQVESLLAGYARLSQALQRVTDFVRLEGSARDPERLYSVVAGYARRHPWCARAFSDLLSVPSERRTFGSRPRVVIHGDFHAKNFAFRGDAFACVFDFGEVCEGLPCGDLVNALVERYSCLSLDAARRRRLRERTRVFLSRMPWPADEIEIAVNVLRLAFAARRIEKHPDSPWVALDVERRDRRIREILKEVS